MDEFNNRMDAQRKVLEVVNQRNGNKEELCGLSKKAIERWIIANRLNPKDEISKILFKISEKLFHQGYLIFREQGNFFLLC